MGAYWGAAVSAPVEPDPVRVTFSSKADPNKNVVFDPLQRRYKCQLRDWPELHLMHESALRDFSVANFRANGCAYFKLPEEATAAVIKLKAILLEHGDELREWLGKDVFNTMDPEQRGKLMQEVSRRNFRRRRQVADNRGRHATDGKSCSWSVRCWRWSIQNRTPQGGVAANRLDFRNGPSRSL